ncbi:MAG: 2,3-bisphosphoglycerate-independent phosphoglycerate mutase [archaeon]
MKKLILIVIDGFGLRREKKYNAIAEAKKPNYDSLWKNCPHTSLCASGECVGLPKGSQGNSEVGHLHMGAGRIVRQPLDRINNSIADKSFFRNKTLAKAAEKAKKAKHIHLIGLCSDGGIHSHVNHLRAIMEFMHSKKLGGKMVLHFVADGRDVGIKTAEKYAEQINGWCKKYGGRVAGICGRFYAMDRDNNWNRTQKFYYLITEGEGKNFPTTQKAIHYAYSKGARSDYYLPAMSIGEKCFIEDNDVVIDFNFRTDRMRQIVRALHLKKFSGFKRKKQPKAFLATMTKYDKKVDCPILFRDVVPGNNLGENISKKGMKQLRIAETDKYPHVTYFFNSQVEKPFKGEDRIMVPSEKVDSYDKTPEMSAEGITQNAVKQIAKNKYGFMLINFANADLVGHSSNHKAIVRAVEKVDECLGRVAKAAKKNNYTLIITSDHGNAEETKYPDGKPKASHTTNPVPLILVSNEKSLSKAKLRKGQLIDVAPTILKIMGIAKPREMTGKPLF